MPGEDEDSEPPLTLEVAQVLLQGGELLRSLLRFVSRGVRQAQLAGEVSTTCATAARPGAGTGAAAKTAARHNDGNVICEVAARRSYAAARVLCATLAGPMAASSLAMAGATGAQVLNFICCELVASLWPGSPAISLHCCTVLHQLMGAHGPMVCIFLLQQSAPFILLRSLNRPGCTALLLAIILGCEAPLPSLQTGLAPRPLGVPVLQQVMQYVRSTQWPQLIAAILQAELNRHCPGVEVDAGAAPLPAPCTKPPGSPWRPSLPPGPQSLMSTPTVCVTSPSELSSAPPSPGAPPVRTPRAHTPRASISARLPSPALPRRPGSRPSPAAQRLPGTPRKVPRTPEKPPSGARKAVRTPRSSPPGLPALPCSPAGGASPAGAGEPGEDKHEAAAILLEFLACLVETAARTRDSVLAAGAFKRQTVDPELSCRATMQHQLLYMVFIETPLASHLFGLMRSGVAQFDIASLLFSLLQQALHPSEWFNWGRDRLHDLYVPHLDAIGKLLLGSGSRGTSRRSRTTQTPRDQTQGCRRATSERLGALRVLAVQFLAAMCQTKPDKTLALVSPEIWTLLVRWFVTHRCNHIFQGACSQLLVAVVRHGSPDLQHTVFVRSQLLAGICELVLVDAAGVGARQRHPGGLGSVSQVVTVLAEVQQSAMDRLRGGFAGVEAPPVAKQRQPLQERAVVPQIQAAQIGTPTKKQFAKAGASSSIVEPTTPRIAAAAVAAVAAGAGATQFIPGHYVARMLASAPSWPQVVKEVCPHMAPCSSE